MDIIPKKKTLTLFYFRFKMSTEGNTDLLDNEEAMLQPSIPELEARIQMLEIRNKELELRNITLTKAVGLLSNMEIDLQTKISRVNKYVATILHRNQERISAITHLETKNESDDQMLILMFSILQNID